MPTTSSSTCSAPKCAASTTSSGCGRSATRTTSRNRPWRRPRAPDSPTVLLHILARGKIGRTSEAELVDRYLKRIAWPTKVSELPDRGGTPPPPATSSVTILLDERGQALSS